MPRPDALIIPESVKRRRAMVDRVVSVADIAEPLLEVDRAAGERAYIRLQQHGKLFVSRDIKDTLFFTNNHPLAMRERYRWELGDDGIQRGYLVDEAKETLSAH